MNVFLSWSGNRSRKIAEFLKEWIGSVLQATKPWVSSEIDRGAIWFGEISDQLAQTKIGIICLTGENKDRPWILFEAGALARGLTTQRVCPFLIDLDHSDVGAPLSQFNLTKPTREEVFSLISTINRQLPSPLELGRLDNIFSTYWPQFETQFKRILDGNPPSKPQSPRSQNDILAELLDLTRNLSARTARLERTSVDDRQFTDRSMSEQAKRHAYEISKMPYAAQLELATEIISDGQERGISIDEMLDVLRRRGFTQSVIGNLLSYHNMKKSMGDADNVAASKPSAPNPPASG